MPTNIKNKAGFTLMELMVVVAIIAILTGVAVPNVLGWMRNRVISNTARQIFNAVQISRLAAIKNSSDAVLEFMDTDGDNYYDSYQAFVDDGFVRMNGDIPEYSNNPTDKDRLSDNGILDSAERVILRDEINNAVKINTASPWGDINYKDGKLRYKAKGRASIGRINMHGGGRHIGIKIDMVGLPRIVKSPDGHTWYYNGKKI